MDLYSPDTCSIFRLVQFYQHRINRCVYYVHILLKQGYSEDDYNYNFKRFLLLSQNASFLQSQIKYVHNNVNPKEKCVFYVLIFILSTDCDFEITRKDMNSNARDRECEFLKRTQCQQVLLFPSIISRTQIEL